jgi:hypothetical protein
VSILKPEAVMFGVESVSPIEGLYVVRVTTSIFAVGFSTYGFTKGNKSPCPNVFGKRKNNTIMFFIPQRYGHYLRTPKKYSKIN